MTAPKPRHVPKPRTKAIHKEVDLTPVKVREEDVYELAMLHCTAQEIASRLGCSGDFIAQNFAETLRKGEDEGKKSLRRKMFEIALKGNCTMLIWLSKQHLGMKEKFPEEDIITSFQLNIIEMPTEKMLTISAEVKDVPVSTKEDVEDVAIYKEKGA